MALLPHPICFFATVFCTGQPYEVDRSTVALFSVEAQARPVE